MPLPERQFHGTVGPPLDDVGRHYSAAALRLRVVNPKSSTRKHDAFVLKVEGYIKFSVAMRKAILTAQEIEDVIAYLLTYGQRRRLYPEGGRTTVAPPHHYTRSMVVAQATPISPRTISACRMTSSPIQGSSG
jgi:hypothetical protein